MANIGRRLQSQLTSLHETVCKETESSKEDSKNWDPFPPELIARLHNSTSDVNCEVKVLERYLDQVRELITLGEKKNNGFKSFNGACYEENNNQTDDRRETSSLKEQIQNEDQRKKCAKEIEFLTHQLQFNGGILDHEGLVRRLENDRSKLELDNYNLKQQLKLIKDKLNERGQLDEELASLTNVECKPGTEDEDGFALSELVTLQKERKVLLATVHKLQNQTIGGKKKSDVDTFDAAIQCKMNVLSQMGNQGVSLSSELEELKKSLNELQTEYDELEEEFKSMEEENGKLMEEKRALEDSVNKLRGQITDALDTSLEEMEHLHQEKEELHSKLQIVEGDNKKLRESFVELSKKNAAHLESVLDEIERKDSLEDAVDYLGTEVQKLNEINASTMYSTSSEACPPGENVEKIHNSSLLSEIKTCKELIDSQREHVRQLQVDKRDIEDSFINLKKEVVILKTKRSDRRLLQHPSGEKESDDSMEPIRKSSVVRCEFLKQDILRLTKRGTELENVIRALKSDNSNLEEEKVCLLDSLYHQLEKNEKLEVQIEQLKNLINENDTTKGLPNGKQRDYSSSDRNRDLNGNVVDGDNTTRVSSEKGEDSSSTGDKSRTMPVQLSEELKSLQERLLEIETEKERIEQDLEESRKNEKELRELVSTMKKEATVNKHQLQKNQEVTDTLQECLREAHEEKQELVESLDEVTEEKTALEKKVEAMENELNELIENYQRVKSELESAKAGVDNVDKAKEQIRSIYAKLSELYESLTEKDKDSSSEENDSGLKETSLEEQGSSILSMVEKVQQEVTLLRKELRGVKVDQEKLIIKMETSQTEKLSLQRYVRELDEKRRQVKSFITKLTEEKEAMSEQMDEIKQQKNNLADALENVYQSKEGLQCQLEDALCKQHESSKSLSEVSAEVQSLKKSLGRMVEERDALKEALLETTNELQTLKKSEAKWKEKVTGAQVEADQSVEDTSDVNKDDDKDAITRLHLENDMLKKQLEELKSSKGSLQEETSKVNEAPVILSGGSETDVSEKPLEREDEIKVTTASQYGSNPSVYDMVTTFDSAAFDEPSNDETDLIVPSDASSTLESVPFGDQQEALDVRLNEVSEEKRLLEVELKRSAEEIEQLKSWFDSISAEKEILEKEQELMAKENEEMLKDLEKARQEEAKLKLRLEEMSKDKEDGHKPQQDIEAILEEKIKEVAQLQENLKKQSDASKELTEALQLSDMRKNSLESDAKESWEKAEALEKSYQSLKAKNEALTKTNSTLKEEKEELSKSLEKLSDENKNLEKRYSEMGAEKERTAWESETRTKEVARLLEQVESLEVKLRGKSHTLAELENILKHVEKEKEDLDVLVNGIKREKEDLAAKQEKLIIDYKALEERLAKAETEKSKENENLKKLKQELEDTTKKLNDETENLQSSLKDVQGKLDTAEDDLELVEGEKDNLLAQVTQFQENEKLLKKQINAKSQENSSLQDSLEKLEGDKQFLTSKLEETKIESNLMRDQLKEFKDQASDLRAFVDESIKKNQTEQSEEIPKGETNVLQYVYEYIEALLEEKASLEAKLEKAEHLNRETQDDNKQLLQERTELTIQLHEALDKESTDESPSRSRSGYDETRLSREISDVRSLIEKLSLQKEKLGAALAHKENQIVAVTAEAIEKAKMLEHKEKEAESLSVTQAEVAVALEQAKNGSEKLLAELECEKRKVESLTRELEHAKNQDNSDLAAALEQAKNGSEKLLAELEREKRKVANLTEELEHAKSEENTDLQLCVSRLEEEKKAFMMAVNKSRELEKRLNKAQEENIKMQEHKNELEANVEAQAASILSFEMIAKENELTWKKDLDEKDVQLESLKQEMKKSNKALTDLLRVVDELKSKIAELEKQCGEAEKSRKEAVEEISNLQKKLNDETERKNTLDAKLEEMEKAMAKQEEENKDLKEQKAANDSDKQTLQRSVKELEVKNKDKAKRLLDLNCTKTSLEDEYKKSSSEIAFLKEELAKKTSSLENIEKKLDDSKDFIHEGKSKYDQLRKEKEDLKKSLHVAESKLRNAEDQNTKTKEQNEKLTKKLEAIEKEMVSLNSAFGEAQSKKETLLNDMNTETVRIESDLENLRHECETLQKKLDETSKENSRLEKEFELKKSVEKDLAKLTEEHKALKMFSQKLVDDKVDQEQTRKEKRELEKQLRREKNERASLEEEMERLRREKVVSNDQMDGGRIPQNDGEEIIASTEGGLLLTEVEMEFATGSAPNHEDGSLEDELAKQRQLTAELHEEIEELVDEKDELNEIIDELRSKTKKLEANVDALIDEKESLEDKLDENAKYFKEEIGSLGDGNKELSRKLEVLLKDKNVLREEIIAKEQAYREVLEEGKKLEEALEKSAREVKRLTKENDSAVKIHIEENSTKIKEKVRELESKLDKMSLEKQEMMSELAERKNENSTLRLAVEEITLAKEDAEMKSGATEKELYDELDHLQKELDEKSKRITSLEEVVADYKQLASLRDQGTKDVELEKPKTDLDELEQLHRKLDEKRKTIESLEEEFGEHKQLTYEREQEINAHLDRIQQKLDEKDKKIASLEAECKQTRQEQKQDIDETMDEIPDKDLKDKLAKLQSELVEKEMRIGSLEEAIVDYKRSRFEQERDFQMKEAHLTAAREEFYKTMKERCEEEERIEGIRRANNRLQEALDLANEKLKQVKKELQQVTGRERSQSLVFEERIRSLSAGNLLESAEKAKITSSKVNELNLSPPSQSEKTTVTSSSIEKARKEIAMLEAHEQELRGELRKARDQVFDLQLELSDALHALRQKERLHEQERKRFQSNIEGMEKEYNRMRKEFSSLISIDKNRSSFITVVELKGSLKKAESDMLEAIAKTAELLSRAKDDIKESRRMDSDKESTDKSHERTRSFIEQSTQENKELLKQLDDAWKERDRLAKRLKRSEGAQALLKQILNESLVEVERFKQLVDCTGRPGKRRSSSVGSQKLKVSTQDLETQSDLTSTDLEEAERLNDCLGELRRNIRGLEECLNEERSKGEGNLLDYLREKNSLNAEITALKQCVQESNTKKDALQSLVSNLQERLELSQREKTAVEIEVTDVRYEVDKLRNLSYDERAEKNSLRQANAELKRSLLETKEKDGKVVKESDKVKELKKEKERLSAENETLKKNVKELKKELGKSNKDNFAAVCKELENAKYRISELSNAKEVAVNKNMAIESELQATKENFEVLEKHHKELKNEYRNLEENCKELENERLQLVEDAHLFKMKMDNKNQDLLSKLEAKEHEAISLQAKVEGLTALQRKLENDYRDLERDKESAVIQVRQLEYDNQRIEAINRDQKAKIERLHVDKGGHKDLNDKLKNLLAEKDKLEEMNRNLEMDVQKLYKALDAKGEDVNKVVQQLQDMDSKVYVYCHLLSLRVYGKL